MKGDFTRNTFNPEKNFLRVLMQQGRCIDSADQNEKLAIVIHLIQTLAADLIGAHGGPDNENLGFEIQGNGNDFTIGPGRYYVNGILCENHPKFDEQNELLLLPYTKQPDYPYPLSEDTELENGQYLVYLDVWERHISHVEDDSIREVALNGPDTATRSKVVWQVKIEPNIGECPSNEKWNELLEQWQPAHRGMLMARAKVGEEIQSTDPCITATQCPISGCRKSALPCRDPQKWLCRYGDL